MTEDEKETLRELEQKLLNLSSDMGMLSSNAGRIEGYIDDLCATVHDLRYKLKISEEWTE